LRSAGTTAVVAAVTVLTTACVAPGAAVVAPEAASTLPTAPPSRVPPRLTQQQVDQAVASLDGLVTDAMERTGVPGVAVAVVYRDQVAYSKGFGVREIGKRRRSTPTRCSSSPRCPSRWRPP
jgi:CubicO group peptidase (beta-lactamase class C family)